MTLALRFAARSDIGLRREGNEDSAYAGPHLLAVADGMGGHAAGEIASAAVITTVAALDTDHAVDDLPAAVTAAVASASERLRELIRADSAREGMGTTLTALVWADGHVAIGHVGDSRAYLLREGQMYRITRDHTKVQSLLDQGKITEAEIATHPERSVLMRALDGLHPVRPDVSAHETLAGDRYLLCSDGLSGVASERAIFQTLRTVADPDRAARRLIELACQAGGPDNITCIVADVIDTAASSDAPTSGSTFVGAAADSASGDLSVSRPDDPRDPGLTASIPQRLIRARLQSALSGDNDATRARAPGNPPSPEPAAGPDPDSDSDPQQPGETALLRQRIAELEAARDRQDAKIADLTGEAAATRSEVRELRAALEERDRKDSTRDLALAGQLRDLKKLRAELARLRGDPDGGDLERNAAPAAARQDTQSSVDPPPRSGK